MSGDDFDPMQVASAGARISKVTAQEPLVTVQFSDGTELPPATVDDLKVALKVAKERASFNTVGDQLRAFIERIERLEEEKKTIADDIKDVYGEAKSTGFDTKAMKKVIAIRKMGEEEFVRETTILDTYLVALGMTTSSGEVA